MKWYCEKCKKIHSNNEMCPRIQKQLKESPELLSEAATFTTIAGEYTLVTTNTLDTIAQGVNKLAGSNLSFEGTQQAARDIQVFRRLNEEAFKRAGVFSSPEKAKIYFENVQKLSETSPRTMESFTSKLTGYSQEADWVRLQQSKLSSVIQKSTLLDSNAAGIDGVTVNRFTGKTISRTTIKASKNPMTQNSTAINDVKEAISKGTATENDIIFGTKGTRAAAQKAGLKNPVIEKNTVEQVNTSNERLKQKVIDGQATTAVTAEQAAKKMAQGAVIGAAVGLTVSSITNYVRYKNGEQSQEEAFLEISEDTLKGALTGGALSGITLFIPGGPIGFIGGMAIGIYVNAVCKNLLDEIYGNGAYGAILNASGYIYGMTCNLEEYVNQIERNVKQTNHTIQRSRQVQAQIYDEFNLFEQMKGE